MNARNLLQKIDRSSHTPPYVQISRVLAAEAAQWSDAARPFHSEETVAARFAVSRMTARRAIAVLVSDGLLRPVRGRGTFVLPQRLTEALTPTMQFERGWKAAGRDTSARVLRHAMLRAPAEVARRLGVPRATRVLCIRRLRLVDGAPIALDLRFIRTDVAERAGLDEARAAGDILQALWRAGPLVRAEWSIEARLATDEEARLLGAESGSAVLLRSMAYVTPDGVTIAIGETVNRADRVRYALDLPLEEATNSEFVSDIMPALQIASR
jgi:GntR family transcriptional regulator